jgi:hypothetical protein
MRRSAVMDEWEKRRRGKNLALLGILLAFIVLIYFVTLARMGAIQ